MSEEMSEMFRMQREHNQQENKKKQDDAHSLINAWCTVHEYKMEKVADYQIRIIGDGKKLDIFPTNKKYHDITKNTRGKYQKLEQFLNQHFGIESNES
jgi:hypothetical protein